MAPETVYPADKGIANREDAMTNQDGQDSDKGETRLMWIGSGVIVLIILGVMGLGMLFHPAPAPDSTELSSQSRSAPEPAQ
jgi:hypothetical protein